jgi:ankyrin repeat protein
MINIKKLEKIIINQNMLEFQLIFNMHNKEKQTEKTEIKYYLNLIKNNDDDPLWWKASHKLKSEENEDQTTIFSTHFVTTSFLNYLLDYGANINVKNKYGQTILMKACETSNIDLIDYLLEKNEIDINSHDDKHMNALHYAVYNLNYEIISKLLKKGIDINHQDIYGWTPLMILLLNTPNQFLIQSEQNKIRADCIYIMLNHKPNISLKNNYHISLSTMIDKFIKKQITKTTSY